MRNLFVNPIYMNLCSAVIIVITLAICLSGMRNDFRRCKALAYVFVTNLVLVLSDTLAFAYNGDPSRMGYIVVRVCNFLFFFSTTIIFAIIIDYLIVAASEKELSQKDQRFILWSRKFRIVIVILNIIMLTISQYTGIIYFFDENNFYHRGPWHFLTVVNGLILIIFMGCVILFFRDKYSTYERHSLLAYVALPCLGMVIQYFNFGINLVPMMVTLSTILVGITYCVVGVPQLAAKNQQIAEQKALIAEYKNQIAVSQIQPHFIFNVLGSIEQLCRVNPQAAEEATHSFSVFLRYSLNSMMATPLVNTTEERVLIQNYIQLEKMRFGDDIHFRMDTHAGIFKIPLMSIQPLVENAVKHGMRDCDEPLNITLHSEENLNSYIIQVIDDGIGFDPEAIKNDGKVHVGLKNVRERIELLCNGTVQVESTIDVGTKVTVIIPKEYQWEDDPDTGTRSRVLN